jgi:hypothetical protein
LIHVRTSILGKDMSNRRKRDKSTPTSPARPARERGLFAIRAAARGTNPPPSAQGAGAAAR